MAISNWVVALLLLSSLTLSQGKKKEPRMILVSLDGFRAEYLSREEVKRIKLLGEEGIHSKRGMFPSFPSKTFPNHYSIVTGLFPESHGIVSNTMYDPVFDATFRISDPVAVGDSRWWGGEPIWNTVEHAGRKSGCCFWPGSEAAIQGIRPSYWQVYNGSLSHDERLDLVFSWLDYSPSLSPDFITLYLSMVDDYGHEYGPDHPKIGEALLEVDRVIGKLIDGLKDRGIYEEMHLVITSDHGMTKITKDKVIFLDDYLDFTKVDIIDWSPIASLIPKPGYIEEVYRNLTSPSKNFRVYLKEEEGERGVPERYEYSNNRRIHPVLIEADMGYSISDHRTFERNPAWYEGGNHGYDNLEEDMAAIFVAHGPKFKNGAIVDPFLNVEMMNLLCKVLELKAPPNNGTENSLLIQQALL